MVKKIISWIIVIIIGITIFGFSSQTGDSSGGMSNAIAAFIVETLNLNINVLTLEEVIRSLAHIGEYFIFGIALLNAWSITVDKYFAAQLLTCEVGAFFAITDEIHQLSVDGRSGSAIDVLKDVLGILLAIIVFTKIRKRKQDRHEKI